MEPENLNCKVCEMRMHCITASKTICEEEYDQMMEQQMNDDQQREDEEYHQRQLYEVEMRRQEKDSY